MAQRDVMTNVLRRPSEDVLAGLDAASSSLKTYKDAQVRLYERIGTGLRRDIQSIERMETFDWRRFQDERSAGLGREIAALVAEENRLNAELEGLRSRSDQSSRQYIAELQGYLASLHKLKDSLTNQRSAYDQASPDDPGPSRTALQSLQKQLDNVADLKSNAQQTRETLEASYSSVRAAVQENAAAVDARARAAARAAGQMAGTSPAAGQTAGPGAGTPSTQSGSPKKEPAGTGGRTPAGNQSKAETVRKDPQTPAPTRQPAESYGSIPTRAVMIGEVSVNRNWFFEERRKGVVGTANSPNHVLFTITRRDGAIMSASLLVWFEVYKDAPNVELECACRIQDGKINCTGQSTHWANGAVYLQPVNPGEFIGELIPSQLQIHASAIAGGGGRVWEMDTKEIRELSADQPVGKK
jgi:hypothetical protein